MLSILWLLVSFFLCFSNAVLIDDAFGSRESINYLYGGSLNNIRLLKNNILVATNSHDQVLGIDVLNHDLIKWKIEINELEKSNVISTDTHIYVYGSCQDIYQIDNLGNLEIIELASIPKKLEDAKYGLLIIDSDNSLKYYNGEFHTIGDNASSIRVDQNKGYMYLLVNDKNLIKLSKTGQVVFTTEVEVGSIKEFKKGIILTGNDQIFKFDERDKTFKRIENDSFKNLVIVDNDLLYAKLNDVVQLIHITKNQKTELLEVIKLKPEAKVELLTTPLNAFLVVSNKNLKQVHDLTDLIDTKDAKSIRQFTFKSTLDFPHEFVSINKDQLNILLINENLVGEVYSLFDGSKVESIQPQIHQYSSKASKYIIIDEPESESIKHELESILHEGDGVYVLTNWIRRVTRHLSELGKFVSSFNFKNLFASNESIGFVKLIVFYDEEYKKFVAVKSNNFAIAWELPIQDDFITLRQIRNGNIIGIFKSTILEINTADGSIVNETANDSGFFDVFNVEDVLGFENKYGFQLSAAVDTNTFFKKVINDNEVAGFVIPVGSLDSKKTWSFKLDEQIISCQNIPADSTTSSLGIPLADKSVLYKYLNPNIISLLTFGKSLKFHLIDGITGNLLYSYTHDPSEIVDLQSINLVMDDNWIIYSYFISEPRLEQRINVIDLFDDQFSSNTSTVASLKTIDKISTKSFIYPERIVQLQSTRSLYGITLKSIVALTESGSLIEIPKFILNSRRPEHEVKAADYGNDFNMVPYDPIVAKTTFQVLNHKYQLNSGSDAGGKGSILVKPTLFESTSVICYFNNENQFCSVIQPSSSFDLLNKGFDKIKLLITIVVLFAGFIISKPFVFNKKLNAQWIDRK
ncbi:uncharacterized endoplasmic reticulum membrane protein precursor, putative [Candida dubliniensis CD36]|uniref:ER membrane protein complex subunit 1 n=1 Tax=Candida dubliniensis (strain CD36 / ATCC MYA-646 / CBS 7987 / NCPF 3949 / NRRL Y-17841) TaxID=573826 RepID=B9WH35_CANDC|nr:uncharacterized endoplasmic reticulum membrane protein precursor, putative [Candida dubliniensis CD36]CAX41476.1 uncharacterized endoplasmic reticulum membrane protein precursor, putative [Candida dubliniensis CD36]